MLQWNRDFLRQSTYGKNFLTKLVNSPETRGYFQAEELLVTQVNTRAQLVKLVLTRFRPTQLC